MVQYTRLSITSRSILLAIRDFDETFLFIGSLVVIPILT